MMINNTSYPSTSSQASRRRAYKDRYQFFNNVVYRSLIAHYWRTRLGVGAVKELSMWLKIGCLRAGIEFPRLAQVYTGSESV